MRGEVSGTWFLVMEYVEGVNLSQLVKQCGPLGIADACQLVRQAAIGLQHAFQHGLVHRDIKPSNLLLTREGEVKVLDLGLALLRDAPESKEEDAKTAPGGSDASAATLATDREATADELTGTGIMGTCDYMAPEQTRGAHEVDIRADIYSLGCTLYRLLAGRAPFEGPEYNTSAKKMAAHAFVAPPLLPNVAETPEELALIVDRMLAKDPSDRFATPAELAEALEPWAKGSNLKALVGGLHVDGGQGKEAAVAGRGSPPRRAQRLLLAAGGGMASLLLGIVLVVSTGKGTVRLEFADAEAARQCTISIDGDVIRLANLGEPIELRPGKHVLRVRHGDLEIETRQFTVRRWGTQVLRLAISDAQVAQPQSAQVHAEQGRAQYFQGEFSNAIAAYGEAIRLAPKNAEYFVGRGDAYAASAQPDRAIADFSQAIELDPTNLDARTSRGLAFRQLGDRNKASLDLEEAILIRPDCARDYGRRWLFFEWRGQNRQAGAELGKMNAVLEQHLETFVRSGPRQVEGPWLDRLLVGFRERLPSASKNDPDWLHWTSCWLPTVIQGVDEIPGIVFASDMPWVLSTSGFNQPGAKRNRQFFHSVHICGLPYLKAIHTNAFENTDHGADVVIALAGQDFTSFKAQVGNSDVRGTTQFQVLVDGNVRCETRVLSSATIQPISADVSGAKEVVLRVLNGKDGAGYDGACWGCPRFVKAGAEDPLEVPPAELRSGAHANAALLLAEVHSHLDHKDLARRWYEKAAEWMVKNPVEAEKLRAFRDEAAQTLGISRKPSTEKERSK
jgi:tetratricopeptide (TPR) repeat protein